MNQLASWTLLQDVMYSVNSLIYLDLINKCNFHAVMCIICVCKYQLFIFIYLFKNANLRKRTVSCQNTLKKNEIHSFLIFSFVEISYMLKVTCIIKFINKQSLF